jgi:hypothetical protein
MSTSITRYPLLPTGHQACRIRAPRQPRFDNRLCTVTKQDDGSVIVNVEGYSLSLMFERTCVAPEPCR